MFLRHSSASQSALWSNKRVIIRWQSSFIQGNTSEGIYSPLCLKRTWKLGTCKFQTLNFEGRKLTKTDKNICSKYLQFDMKFWEVLQTIQLHIISLRCSKYCFCVFVRSSLLFPQVGVWRGSLVFNNNLLVNWSFTFCSEVCILVEWRGCSHLLFWCTCDCVHWVPL